jgi:polyhydroxybutyrate depolymerase
VAALLPVVGGGAAVAKAGAGSVAVPARPSAGCSVATPVAGGTTTPLLYAAGEAGGYVQEIPPGYAGRQPLPVVVDLHGLSEPAPLQVALTQLGTYGASHGFITITPQVSDPEPLWLTSIGSKDLAYFGALLQRVSATLCIDRNRIFVAGYSNGAFMASSIACQYASQVAAVAPVAGLTNPVGCRPSRPVPIVAFHGTADQYVAYTGGLGPLGQTLADPFGGHQNISQALGGGAPRPRGPSIPAIAATWARRNGCAPQPHDRKVDGDVTLIAYSCRHNATVELYRIAGGGHSWPGSTFAEGISGSLGHTSLTISADQVMWQFFEAHPLRR